MAQYQSFFWGRSSPVSAADRAPMSTEDERSKLHGIVFLGHERTEAIVESSYWLMVQKLWWIMMKFLLLTSPFVWQHTDTCQMMSYVFTQLTRIRSVWWCLNVFWKSQWCPKNSTWFKPVFCQPLVLRRHSIRILHHKFWISLDDLWARPPISRHQ